MTQHSTKQRQILRDIQKQHEELVLQNAGTDSADAEKVQAFLRFIAEAGKDIENAQERSILRNLMYYWSGVAYKKTGHFPIIPLQPLSLDVVSEKAKKVQEDINRRKKARSIILLISCTTAIVALIIALPLLWTSTKVNRAASGSTGISAVPTLPNFPAGIGVFNATNGDTIGISDGRSIFDDSRIDKTLKLQGAERLKANDVGSAIASWQLALGQDTSDAEAAIYLEDQRVLASGRPYVTLVVATTFQQATSTDDISRETLQGTYIAQKQANESCTLVQCRQVRLLIANSGTSPAYATAVAKQIVQVAGTDKTCLGVIGWSSSSQTINALSLLAKADIPLLSQSASSDVLTNISPSFFRIVPSAAQESSIEAKYVIEKLKAKRVALFVDPMEPGSQSLAQGFATAFTAAKKGSIVVVEDYETGKSDTFKALLQNALTHNPDLIYFPGFPEDAMQLLKDLPSTGSFAQLPIMGTTALSALVSYPTNQSTNLKQLYFTAFANPDQWDYLGLSNEKPAFFAEYPLAFDPNEKHVKVYGYSRPGVSTILSYDAAETFLHATLIALQSQSSLTPAVIAQSLVKINGSQALQGVAGQISFGSDHNPINKALVVLHSDAQNYLTIQSVSGCFLVGCSK